MSDPLRSLPDGEVRLDGALARTTRLVVERHLMALPWPRLLDVFRERPDPFATGEFWGKTVRAACPLARQLGDEALLAQVAASVDGLLATQDPDGCISTRSRAQQPLSSDLWERKYVLLGLLAWHEAGGGPRALAAAVRLADHVLSLVGPPPKRRITDTGWAFAGIESSSILEPMLRLHRLTGERRLLDFARYIVEEEGACGRADLFAAPLAGVAPKDVGGNGDPAQSIAKAYESLSCFEGLLDYHRATGEGRWLAAAQAYWRMVQAREITCLGSGGGEGPHNRGPGRGEQWNDLALDQAEPTPRLMMETCVTVTWMKFTLQLLRLTGEAALGDALERSLHNALLGALRPDGTAWDYFQPLAGTRGAADNFAADLGGFRLSCCTANGPMGLAILPQAAVLAEDAGAAVVLYLPLSTRIPLPGGGAARLEIATAYPRDGRVRITVHPERPARFALRLRIPAWSARTRLSVAGGELPAAAGTWAVVERAWREGDVVELELDLRCRIVPAPRGAYHAVERGPLVLARDRRLGGDPDAPVALAGEGTAVPPTVPAQVQVRLPTRDGGAVELIDYAAAGATWDEGSRLRVWLPDG